MQLVPKVYYLPLTDILPDPNQPRKEFEALDDLAGSLKEHGLMTPITVRPSGDGKYWIVAGERRYRAAQLAGQETIACIVDDQKRSDTEITIRQLVENCQREALRPLEMAVSYESLMAATGWTAKQLAAKLSVSQSAVTMTLALLSLPEDIKAKVADGSLSAASAYQLSTLHNDREQREMAARIIEENLSRDEVRDAIQERKGKAKPKKAAKFEDKLGPKGWTLAIIVQRTKPLSEDEVLDVVSAWLSGKREKAREEAA